MLKIIKFSATWCSPCKALAPKFKEISEKYSSSEIKFQEIDIDKNQKLTEEYKVRSIPAVFIIKDENIVDKIIGNSPEKIIQSIEIYKQ